MKIDKKKYTLKELLKDYILHEGNALKNDKEFYLKSKNIKLTIMLACLSIESTGKKHSHQQRIEVDSLIKAGNKLLQFETEIESIKDFNELHIFILNKTKDISKFGELCSYDTTLRIGFNLGIFPEKIYLHAGAKTGAKNLKWITHNNIVDISEIPVKHSLLNILEPFEIENFLCIYNKQLKLLKN
jgi:hypothetical protein